MRHLYRSFCLLKSVTPLLGLIILATSCGKDPAVDPDTDGTVRIAKECTSGLKPVNIVITGDGFLEEDYATGGAFDQAANRAIDALFSVEPFKTYSAYFRVQTVTAYSEERGATLKNASTKTNTIFGVTLDGGSSTGMSGKDDKVVRLREESTGNNRHRTEANGCNRDFELRAIRRHDLLVQRRAFDRLYRTKQRDQPTHPVRECRGT